MTTLLYRCFPEKSHLLLTKTHKWAEWQKLDRNAPSRRTWMRSARTGLQTFGKSAVWESGNLASLSGSATEWICQRWAVTFVKPCPYRTRTCCPPLLFHTCWQGCFVMAGARAAILGPWVSLQIKQKSKLQQRSCLLTPTWKRNKFNKQISILFKPVLVSFSFCSEMTLIWIKR